MVQYINTVVIILLINTKYDKLIKFPGWVPIFSGDFSDFEYSWFSEIGYAIIISTFIMSIFPLMNLGFMGLSMCKRCVDRGCSLDRGRTR